MKGTYKLALEIADDFCIKLLKARYKEHHATDSSIHSLLDNSWIEIVHRGLVESELLIIHRDVYESAYRVLSEKGPNEKASNIEARIKTVTTLVPESTCTDPRHVKGCQCNDNGAYKEKVELFYENSGE